MRDKHNQTSLFINLLLLLLKLPLLFSVFVSLFLVFSIPLTVLADVNLREGSFHTASSEIAVGHFFITRHYNSRSTQIGDFGFGWSSNLKEILADSAVTKNLTLVREKNSMLIREIKLKNKSWHFHYHHFDLISVEFHDRRKQIILAQYQYDLLHNLTKITYPDGSDEQITYFTDEDQVQSYKDQTGCFEKYAYQQPQKLSSTLLINRTFVSHNCSPNKNISYEFWIQKQRNGQSILLKAQIASETKKINLKFNRVSGQVENSTSY